MNATNKLRDWDLIVAVMGIRGNANRILPEAADRRVRANADGFGRMSIVELKRLGILYDWSHIRDSSDAGQRAVARAIRQELRELDVRRAAKFGMSPDDFQSHESMVGEIVAKLGTVPA
jgi:hypothetical protein